MVADVSMSHRRRRWDVRGNWIAAFRRGSNGRLRRADSPPATKPAWSAQGNALSRETTYPQNRTLPHENFFGAIAKPPKPRARGPRAVGKIGIIAQKSWLEGHRATCRPRKTVKRLLPKVTQVCTVCKQNRGNSMTATIHVDSCGWTGRNSVICIRKRIASRSVTGSPITARDGMSIRNSGCLTRYRSPLDMRTSNGSNGRRFNISRIASAFIDSPVKMGRSYA